MSIDDSNVAYIENIVFLNKQNIPWNEVEVYLKNYIGKSYTVEETKDVICVSVDFPDEYTESKYTKSLRGSIAKAKANASQVVGKMIVVATNRRWIENKDKKHEKDAEKGWYRYDTYFGVPVQGSEESVARVNIFRATLVVRISLKGLFLYDVVNIKKKRVSRLGHRPYGRKPLLFEYSSIDARKKQDESLSLCQ